MKVLAVPAKVNEETVNITAYNGMEFLISYKVVHGGEVLKPIALTIVGARIKVVFAACTVLDIVSENQNRFVFNRKWKILKPGNWALYFDVEAKIKNAEVMYPAIMYNGNKSGKGLFPRGGLSNSWSIREDRLPIPSFSMVYNKNISLSLYTDPASSEEFISSILSENSGEKVYQTIRIPAREEPFSFNGKASAVESKNIPPSYQFVGEKDIPFTYNRNFYLQADCRSDSNLPLREYKTLVENLDAGSSESIPSESSDWSEFVRLKFNNLLFLLQESEDPLYSYFIMGRGNGVHQPVYNYTAGSFLVRSLDGAYILARIGYLNKRVDLLEKARGVGEFFLGGKRALGLHYDNYDLEKKEWGGYLGISENDDFKLMFNSRANGETMAAYVRLYKQLSEAGIESSRFLDLAVENADFYLSHQLENGSFGRWWSGEGDVVDSRGTNGAHVVSFLIELAPYYSDRSKLEQALRKASSYYGSLVENDEYYGDTLDADAYDRESGQILLHMFMDLYLYEPLPEYLNKAKKAADFLLTWIWQYDVVFPPGTPLYNRSFKTSGMTSVSVAHHHLDFYGMQIGYDFLRVWRNTNIGIYKTMGLKMINACRQLIATSQDTLGRTPEFEGWQPEQINHTAWEYFNRKDHQKGYFDICISWVTILELSALLNLKEEFPEYIDFVFPD